MQSTCAEAVEFVRDHGRPAFLRIQTDRLNAHSKGDDDRPADEMAAYRRRDLLNEFLEQEPDRAAELLEPIERRISQAISAGLEAAYPATVDYDDLPASAPHHWSAARRIEACPLRAKRFATAFMSG